MRHVRRSCRRKGGRLHGATADRRKRQREAADGPTPTDGRRAGAATNPAHAALPGPRSPRARPRTFAGRIALPCSSLPSEDGAERRLFSSRMPIFRTRSFAPIPPRPGSNPYRAGSNRTRHCRLPTANLSRALRRSGSSSLARPRMRHAAQHTIAIPARSPPFAPRLPPFGMPCPAAPPEP